jgi:hypothetical protein
MRPRKVREGGSRGLTSDWKASRPERGWPGEMLAAVHTPVSAARITINAKLQSFVDVSSAIP